jgi:hypothetical protein
MFTTYLRFWIFNASGIGGAYTISFFKLTLNSFGATRRFTPEWRGPCTATAGLA